MDHTGVYLQESSPVSLNSVIGDLPALRSGVGKSYLDSYHHEVMATGRPKRLYERLEDGVEMWSSVFEGRRSQLPETALLDEVTGLRPVSETTASS